MAMAANQKLLKTVEMWYKINRYLREGLQQDT